MRAVAASARAVGFAFGSSAFTRTETEREFEISLVNDDEAQLFTEMGETEVASVEDEVVELALTDLNVDAVTSYVNAPTIRNESETGHPVFLYVPSIRAGNYGHSHPN